MTTLRSAVQHYVALRRALGFSCAMPQVALAIRGVHGSRRASHITTPLALAWAQQPQTVQAGRMGPAPEYRADLRALSPCDGPAHRDPARRTPSVSPATRATVSLRG